MKIFITGASGFVGRALCNFLTDGMDTIHEVTGLFHDMDHRTRINQSTNWRGVFGDIRNSERMREILWFYQPDAILHLAAQALVPEAERNPYSTFDINVNGTISILNAWAQVCPGAYFLHFSSDKVYGVGLNKSELDPAVASMQQPYASSKAAADIIAQNYLPNICITRSCNIYGPGDTHLSRLIPGTIDSCERGEAPRIRNPKALREYIYIQDVARIVSWLVKNRKLGEWNLGSGQVLQTHEVVQEILTHYPKLKWESKAESTMELPAQSLNSDKLCREMDCLSFVILHAGIKKTVEWRKKERPL